MWWYKLDSVIGPITICGSDKGLSSLTFLGPPPSLLKKENDCGLPDVFANFETELSKYLQGVKVAFDYPIDFGPATPFQIDVWEQTRLIPFGETRSYRSIALKVNNPGAFRAVGQALGKNPVPLLVPCHRVIASDGRLGGFTAGISTKVHLLQLEGISIDHGKCRDGSSLVPHA